MKVFFDNCTSPVLAATMDGFLTHLDHAAFHIRDLPCGRHASDVEWIRYLAETGDWLVVTGDGRIHKNKAERKSVQAGSSQGVGLSPSYQRTPINQQASFLLWRWPDIQGLLKLASPFLFELPMSRSSGIKQLPL